jgi:large-conductance mechanosensitive channel
MLNSIVPSVNVRGDFKDFLVNNNILTMMAAVTIAFSTGIMIRSLVGNVVLPGFYWVIRRQGIPILAEFAPISATNMSEFLGDAVSWVFVVILTFLLIEYIIRRWLLKIPTNNVEEKRVKQ